ncbi:polyol transporter 5-like [Tasmannia lanceolata]|uniref:polyol transporter 5-like n=1 Tax=Tasmannia lanceolata TaxID=3420 RepID=UPI00406454CB
MGDRNFEKTADSDVSGNSVPATTTKKRRRNKYVLGCTVLASMSSILLGYDYGVMTGAVLFIKDDLKINDTKVEILLGILNVYSVIGSTAGGRTCDWIGRRYTIVSGAVIFFTGALMMGLATNYAFLMVGRFVTGIGMGYAVMIAPVYTAELSPTLSRGFLTSLPEVFINFGILLGYVSNYAFSRLPEHINWRLMLGVGVVPSVLLGIGALMMPESPRWLVMQGRLGEARGVLIKTSESKEEAELRLSDIKSAVGIPESSNEDVVQVSKRSHGEGVWKELLIRPTASVRRVLIAAVGIHVLQQASGIDTVVLYSPRIFEKAGVKKKNDLLGATIAVGFSKTIFILVATFLLDRIGRRRLLLTGTAGMIVSLLGLGFGLTIIDHNPDKKLMWAIVLCIITVLSFVGFFSIGLGPICWVYSSEIFPLRLRAQGVALGVAMNRITSGVFAMTFISMYNAMTIGGTFFMFAGIATLSWFFFYTLLPETRGKTLEEMESLFAKPMWRSNEKEQGNRGQVELGNAV